MKKDSENQKRSPLTEAFCKMYCKKRRAVEREEVTKDDPEYATFRRMEEDIINKGYDPDDIYRKFLKGRDHLDPIEAQDLEDAEDLLQEPVVDRKSTTFKRPELNKEFVEKEDIEQQTWDGGGTSTTKETRPVAACGKTISIDEVAGLCSVCRKAVCSEHVAYCVGYGSSRCAKLLCPNCVNSFHDADGNSHPCCRKHYLDWEDFHPSQPIKPGVSDEPEGGQEKTGK